MIDTEQKILSKALELFNEKGIEYVGMRELATALKMRIGNLTYYFPTKDDLVFRVSEEYSAVNSKMHASHPVNTLYDFLKKTEIIFGQQIKYRCLLLSMVHLMERNDKILNAYQHVQKNRKNLLQENIKTINANKYLKASPEDEWFLVSINSLMARFWISESALSGKRLGLEKQAPHYLKLLANLFRPYATRKGLLDIERFLEEIKHK
jgi:AcrR family transcriptional regulator